ncbi:hypothetical protein C8R48DRAFT_771865 [Suillus tomentosus]|nr:hypothetical protein C8R48DRAFT_771865 [Suillus tomentosus]
MIKVKIARQRTRAQTAAFLLGVRSNLPDVNDEDFSRVNAVRHFYEGITDHESKSIEKVTARRYQAPELEKVEFRVPLHTLDRFQSITYVDKLHSESDSRRDIFDSIKATMDVPELYKHLGWRLSTARRTDPPHRLLTTHDIDSAFKAVREEESNFGRRKKKAVIEIVNTAPVLKEKLTQRKAGISSSVSEQSLPSRLLYAKEFDDVKRKLRCSDHPGDNTFCWVDATQPNAPHYPLCTQDLQEWAKYLHQTQDPDNTCVTLPNTLHFDEIRRTRKARSTPSLERVPTEVISPIRIHNHIHLSPATNDTMISRDGTLARQQGHPATPPPPLKRTYALYMDSDDESSDDEPPQDIEDVITSVHSRYPTINFPQYIGKLKDHGVLYLPIAAYFTTGFYKEQIGMSDGAAHTFQNCVSRAYVKAERAKGRKKIKGKKKARAQHDESGDEENIPPT